MINISSEDHQQQQQQQRQSRKRQAAMKFLSSIQMSDSAGGSQQSNQIDLIPPIQSDEQAPNSNGKEGGGEPAPIQKKIKSKRQLTAERFLLGINFHGGDSSASTESEHQSPPSSAPNDLPPLDAAKDCGGDQYKSPLFGSSPASGDMLDTVDGSQQQQQDMITASKRTVGGEFVNNRLTLNGIVNGTKDPRLVYVLRDSNQPVAVHSVISYKDIARRKAIALANQLQLSGDYSRQMNGSVDNLRHQRMAAQSFSHLLIPQQSALQSFIGGASGGQSYSQNQQVSSQQSSYDPNFLDDPNLKTGTYKTVITLQSYISSILQYAKAAELKQELNEQFLQKHDDLGDGITLSKIRNLKLHLLEVGLVVNLELSTVAKAIVFLEKLILSKYVTKSNRKVIAGACLLIAAKINDRKSMNYVKLLQALEKNLMVSSEYIRVQEFAVFAKLEFNVLVPDEEYMPHLMRLVYLLDYNNLQEYVDGKVSTVRELHYI
ncbi:hypothetical protein MIR68_011306 [Amoeboaphelidium protococcarum]|nr:hypothetical protein MIR68_011306 [Amoeboaphelidium protococcarum]